MATTPPFKYQPMFEKGKDTTEYYLLTKDYVSVSEFEGKPILKIEKDGLTAMANAAFRDVSLSLASGSLRILATCSLCERRNMNDTSRKAALAIAVKPSFSIFRIGFPSNSLTDT